ncbi:hypothetical protein HOY80DRAFT_1001443 [Tuber brumale]|nr:hypothetical protein HOY80DRAFT_1001443 [Tuber brumale]
MFDLRIISTVSAVSTKQEPAIKRERNGKTKKVHFDLSANTLHKYDWSTLGHDNFPERLTRDERYLCMLKYKDAIIQRFPELAHGGWSHHIGRFEYSYLIYEEEKENMMRKRRAEALAEILMWSSLIILASCSALLIWWLDL